ncbi:LemA family protein [Streptococcus pseudopneumoniae]|uniref:LemA family protein n=1 Tax=Streptococcus pseudopneumoniae TaxID=257758 RepID=UPI00066A3981|nr:LemA family protein [Streptococcus pseudopneumoniae]
MSNLFNNPFFRIIRGVLIIVLLTLVWLFIFAAFNNSGSETNYEPFEGASIVFSVLSYLVIVFIFQYHKVINLKELIRSSYSAIEIKEQYVEKLIIQLREFTDKIVDHELKMSIRKSTSELLEEKRSVNNSTNDENEANHSESKRKFYGESGTSSRHEHSSIVEDTKNKILEQIERDTSVTADQSIKDLIAEIKESEVLVANQKLHYNEMVSEYNKAIYSLPLAFLRTTLGLFEKEYL